MKCVVFDTRNIFFIPTVVVPREWAFPYRAKNNVSRGSIIGLNNEYTKTKKIRELYPL